MAAGFLKVVFFDLGKTLVVQSEGWVPGAKVALSTLKAKGTRLGIISNTGDLTRSQLAPMLPDDFDFGDFEENLIVLSKEVGVEKPSREIFRMAVNKTGLNPTDSLYCSESLVETLMAEQVGLRICRVNPPPNSDIHRLVPALEATGMVQR